MLLEVVGLLAHIILAVDTLEAVEGRWHGSS